MSEQEALKLAIDFIERYADRHGYHTDGKKVVDACKSALHEHELYSVPVTYLKFYSYEAGLDRHEGFEEVSKHTEDAFPVYTTPQRQQPLKRLDAGKVGFIFRKEMSLFEFYNALMDATEELNNV